MPNWCRNVVTVTGSVSEVRKFASFLKQKKRECVEAEVDFSLDWIVPCKVSELIEVFDCFKNWSVVSKNNGDSISQKFYDCLASDVLKVIKLADSDLQNDVFVKSSSTHPLWYVWNCRNWGTKWDCGESRVSIGTRKVVLTFDTAWACPDPVIQTMSCMFPELTFSVAYTLEGDESTIRFVLKNGVEI